MFYFSSNKKQKTERGFTLIEIMVSVSIFTIVMTISMGALLSILDTNRKAQALKSVMNNLNFALESMTRDLRFGMYYQCGYGGGAVTPSDCAGGESSIGMISNRDIDGDGKISDSGDIIAYGFKVTNPSTGEGQIFKAIKGENPSNISASGVFPITAPEIKIQSLKFYVSGSDQSDTVQPKILLVVKGYAGTKDNIKSYFNLQTTISQRCFDIGTCIPL